MLTFQIKLPEMYEIFFITLIEDYLSSGIGQFVTIFFC